VWCDDGYPVRDRRQNKIGSRFLRPHSKSGVVKAIVSTGGAPWRRDWSKAAGDSHFVQPKMGDSELFQDGYNRVYDSLEPETNLDHVEEVIGPPSSEWEAEGHRLCSWKSHRRMAKIGHQKLCRGGESDPLRAQTFPSLFPAFSDSERASTSRLHKIAGSRKAPRCCVPIPSRIGEICDNMLALRRMGILTGGRKAARALVATIRRLRELLAPARLQKIPLKRYNYGARALPGAGPWGGLKRQHVTRSGILGN